MSIASSNRGFDYTNDLSVLEQWVGQSRNTTDVITEASCLKLSHTLGGHTLPTSRIPAIGDAIAPLWHFIAHQGSVPNDRLGLDGHPKRGDFLPPVALPRRMWAGGRFRFHHDLHVGDLVVKNSTVDRIEMKTGRSGSLCFVTVSHSLAVAGKTCVEEEQDLVYRDDPDPDALRPAAKPARTDADFSTVITPSEVMLFRYSALTFNGHRIHYDRDYARTVEGYPALVFHGPLTATLLAGLAVSQTGRRLKTFSFRGLAPLFDTAPFTISGAVDRDSVSLWATTPEGGIAMQASADLAD